MKLSTKILGVVLGVSVLVAGIFAAGSYFVLHQAETEEIERAASQLIENTAEVASSAARVFFAQFENEMRDRARFGAEFDLVAYANEIDPEGAHVVIIDRQGLSHRGAQPLVQTFSLLTVDRLEREWRRFETSGLREFSVENLVSAFRENASARVPVYFRFRIREESGLFVGYGRELKLAKARVDFLRRSNTARVRDFMKISLTLLLVTFVVVALLVRGLIRKWIVRPLEMVVAGFRTVAKGAIDHRVEVTSRDELGSMCDSFNAMTERLATTLDSLRDREERLSTTLNSIGDAVVSTDSQGRIVTMNPVAEVLTGWAAGDAVGRHIDEVFTILDVRNREPMESPVSRILSDRSLAGLADQVILLSRDSKEFRISNSGAPIRGEDGAIDGVVLVFRDVTDEHATQEELRHAQKMEAVGQLAGGVAHDFNNLLLVVLGRVDIARREDAAAAPVVRESLEEIQIAGERASELTRQLLQFSRKRSIEVETLSIGDVVRDLSRLLARLIPATIEVRLELDGKGLVETNRGHIEQIVTNVCVNARDAMPSGGTLSIRVADVFNETEFVTSHPWARVGPFVRLSISDTGAGIAPEDRVRIFEPFFTTKPVGEGSGLGLSIVYGILHQHNATCGVESEPGKGTTFRFDFPESTTRRAKPAESDLGELWGGGEIVLLAEDDLKVRDLCTKFLESAGYSVIVAHNGQVALDRIVENRERIDVMILDSIMPKVSGTEVYEEARRRMGEVPVVFTSGYPDATIPQGERVAMLMKPYTRESLLSEVKRVLEGNGQS